jgi:hypothetical protein
LESDVFVERNDPKFDRKDIDLALAPYASLTQRILTPSSYVRQTPAGYVASSKLCPRIGECDSSDGVTLPYLSGLRCISVFSTWRRGRVHEHKDAGVILHEHFAAAAALQS